jgi:hypothetical protein
MPIMKRIRDYFSKSNENLKSKIESTVFTPIEKKYKKNHVFQNIYSRDLAGRRVSLINDQNETIATGKIICVNSENEHDKTEITISDENKFYQDETHQRDFTHIQFHKDGIVTLDEIIQTLNEYERNYHGGKRVRKNKTRKAKMSNKRKSNKRK